jgi:trimethylamine-N-oxide reductase (cytochrome c)
VDVKDDRIIRIEPMQFKEDEVKSWEVEVNGKTYRPPLTMPLLPWGIPLKKMAYSENRVLYPHKRVDWDPKGERNIENRGKSGYTRISWDEAFDILKDEFDRILDHYGSPALCFTNCAHPEWGSLHYFFSDLYRFRDLVGGSFIESTPISWEGWSCGAPFVWGNWLGHGLPSANDTLQDVSEESELIVLWACDPLLHEVYNGIDTARLWKWWKELGKEIVVIDPMFNETGLYSADVWLPIIPGTDGALACALAYVWIVDGTYDREFLETHAVGFDEEHMPDGSYNLEWLEEHPLWKEGLPSSVRPGLSFKSYIVGTGEDIAAKTPEWAAEICGIPARKIRALAKAWAKRPTSFWGVLGGGTRRTFAHEEARLKIVLAAMQGMGTPGSNILGLSGVFSGPYDNIRQIGPNGYADGGMNLVLDRYYPNPIKQTITFTKLKDCLYDPPQHWRGGHIDNFGPEMFFEEMDYPQPGCSEVKLIWMRGSTLMNPPDLKNQHLAYLAPGVETLIVTAPWFDRDCRFADLVLPVTTLFEHQDLTEPGSVGQYIPGAYCLLRSAVLHQKAIEPRGESKTDLQIFAELAERLGRGDDYLEGNTEDMLLEKLYARTNIPLEYDAFKEKGYFVWPYLDDYRRDKQFARFHDFPMFAPFPFDPMNPKNCLDTPTGKLEIYSTLIHAVHGDTNPEIPCVPQYIPEKEGFYDPKRGEYPLQMLMAHPKFRFHGKYDRLSRLAENYKVFGPEGYPYEPCMINPADALRRGIADGDIIRVFNDRGQVLAGAVISNRIKEGAAWLSYGAWDDPLSPEPGSLDRAGNGNELSYAGAQSAHHMGGAFNSVLIEIEKADLSRLQEQYPEGFQGKWSSWRKGE